MFSYYCSNLKTVFINVIVISIAITDEGFIITFKTQNNQEYIVDIEKPSDKYEKRPLKLFCYEIETLKGFVTYKDIQEKAFSIKALEEC